MITLSIDMTEDQAEEMVDSIQDALDEDEAWKPEFTFQPEDAENIQRNLRFQVRHNDHYYENL